MQPSASDQPVRALLLVALAVALIVAAVVGVWIGLAEQHQPVSPAVTETPAISGR